MKVEMLSEVKRIEMNVLNLMNFSLKKSGRVKNEERELLKVKLIGELEKKVVR